jgi:hypothetical protein
MGACLQLCGIGVKSSKVDLLPISSPVRPTEPIERPLTRVLTVGLEGLPVAIVQCIEVIRNSRLRENGIFRVPGPEEDIVTLKKKLYAGEKLDNLEKTDTHAIASFIKAYFREREEPLLTSEIYPKLVATYRAGDLNGLGKHVRKLPEQSYNAFLYLFQFFSDVVAEAETNYMTSRNLAVVFGPNLYRSAASTPESVVSEAVLMLLVIQCLIEQIASARSGQKTDWYEISPRSPIPRPRASLIATTTQNNTRTSQLLANSPKRKTTEGGEEVKRSASTLFLGPPGSLDEVFEV